MKNRFLLLFPPVFYPHIPYLGLPLLQAYLAKYGIISHQVDLNISSYQYFLSENNLKTAFNKIKDLVKNNYFEMATPRKLELTSSNAMEYIITHSSEATDVVRGHRMSEISNENAQRILDLCLDIISDCYFPSGLTFSGLRMSYSSKSSNDISSAIYDKKVNMFIDFYETVLPSIFQEQCPTFVGISINVPDQIIPGFTLCNAIRQLDKNIKIIIGGNIITRLNDFFKTQNSLNQFYDCCVFGEGETSLLKIFNQGFKIDSPINKKRYFESQGSISPDEIPCPDFSDLPLGDYFDRAVVLPILASRRCYWDKCNFCSISAGYSPRYRKAKAKKIVDDIQLLQKKHNNTFFKFVDDAASPSLLVDIADELIKRDLNIYWEAYTILEKEFANRDFCKKLYDSGCRWLYFGLETADTQLAKSMNKRLINDPPETILRTVNDTGINTHIWIILGYPSDMQKRVDCTVKFIEKNQNFIDSVEANQFALVRGAPILNKGAFEKYGIKQIVNPNEDMALTYDFEIKDGMSQEEAKKITKEVRRYLEKDLGYVNAVRSTKLLSERFKINAVKTKNGGKYEEVIH